MPSYLRMGKLPFPVPSMTLNLVFFQGKSTEKVLILEFMDGIRLNDFESLDSFGVNKQKIVEEITRAYAHQIYIDGFFNGDPHPGILLQPFYSF